MAGVMAIDSDMNRKRQSKSRLTPLTMATSGTETGISWITMIKTPGRIPFLLKRRFRKHRQTDLRDTAASLFPASRAVQRTT